MRKVLQFLLKILAKLTLWRYRPRIVGVTGSVGKTGSCLAIAAVLQTRWRVGRGEKNFNNEIGLPLTILGEADSGYRHPLIWLGIFFRAIKHLIIRNNHYPQVLVLEYGVDRPGDMKYLLSIASPVVAVVTAVAETHLEFFDSVAGVAKEKGYLVAALPPHGVAVLNMDFPLVQSMKAKTTARVIGYGQVNTAEVRLTGVAVSYTDDDQPQGMSFRLTIGGSTVPVLIKGTVGRPVAGYAAAAAAVGYALGLSVLEITNGLKNFVPPAGRLRLINGFSSTLIIDDTYNSSPQAVKEALDVLSQLKFKNNFRRWAVLGDMLELGHDSQKLHELIGERVADLPIDFLVTVGKEARYIFEAARRRGMPAEHSWQVLTIAEAERILKAHLQAGDVILVKASQGVRLERLVQALMAEPYLSQQLLVRQSKIWTRSP